MFILNYQIPVFILNNYPLTIRYNTQYARIERSVCEGRVALECTRGSKCRLLAPHFPRYFPIDLLILTFVDVKPYLSYFNQSRLVSKADEY